MRNLVIGGLIFLAAVGITITSYMSAPTGGRFYIFYGAMAAGAGIAIRGLIQMSQEGRAPKVPAAAPIPSFNGSIAAAGAAPSPMASAPRIAVPEIPVLADTSYLHKSTEELSPHEAIALRRAQRLAAEQHNN